MIILAIETSCDETAVAVLDIEKGKKNFPPKFPKTKILSNLIASQHDIHGPYGGIFPELASRRHIEVIRPMVEDALKAAKIAPKKLSGVAVTNAPGLVGALLVGLSFAKAYAMGLGIPFIGVNHLEGHLNAPLLAHEKIPYPHLGLVVSGGHTALYLVKKFGEYRYLGGTRDDAAGEAFDKVAKLLDLGYPGGPVVDKTAKAGNPKAIKFPTPKLPAYEFSFSGLKTFTRQLIEKNAHSVADVCASFQEAVVDVLVEKTLAAAKAYRCPSIVLTGGVACNSRLRTKMTEAALKAKKKAYIAPPVYCTDNASMIGYVGGRYLLQGKSSSLTLNAVANMGFMNRGNENE